MTLVGRTRNGTRIVEISTEELAALMAAKKVLDNLQVDYCVNDIPAPAAPAAKPEEAPPASKTRKTRKVKDEKAERLCAWCQKPLPANACSTRKFHKGECEKLIKRKWAREAYRAKHGVKHPQPRATSIEPPANPADPSLTNEQREAAIQAKAKRLEMIKLIAARTE